jgi:tRNA modification GTPase
VKKPLKKVDQKSENIAAIATGTGRGGIGVVRISGKNLAEMGLELTGHKLPPRQAVYTKFLAADHTILDEGIALFFPAPHSYTGEEVLELQGHGGSAVLLSVLQRCLELGARIAHPGEFTQRAFLNDKMDLAQAESVADLIEATTQQAASSAVRSLQGVFSEAIRAVVSKLIDLRMRVEATLDFPEEDGIATIERERVLGRLDGIRNELLHIESLAKQGSILREGAQVVLVGAPNVGKSSLLNRLAGEDIALVSEVAGTTRDAVRQSLQINGIPLHIIDTAGIRETQDIVERMGIARTQQNIERADLILILSDDSNNNAITDEISILSRLPSKIPRLFIHNKIDLSGQHSQIMQQGDNIHIYVSALTGAGIEILQMKMLQKIGWHQEAGVFMARERHLVAISTAKQHLISADKQLDNLELLAEELRYAQSALNAITGEFVADDLLGEIFSRFCIGK